MKSSPHGARTSAVEVTHIDAFGVWVLALEKEYFLPYGQFPWFRDAKVRDILAVELLHGDHLRWPVLDVDLSLESLGNPDGFPLVNK